MMLLATWTFTDIQWMNNIVKSSLNPLDSQTNRYKVKTETLVDSFSWLFFQIQMKWMDFSHNNVNQNISLAQFSFNVQLMDSYSTDYYELSYPGLIMRVRYFTDQLWHLTFMNMNKKLISNATTYKMAFSMQHWLQDEFLISCLSFSSYCSLTNIYSWSHCSENSPTRKL